MKFRAYCIFPHSAPHSTIACFCDYGFWLCSVLLFSANLFSVLSVVFRNMNSWLPPFAHDVVFIWRLPWQMLWPKVWWHYDWLCVGRSVFCGVMYTKRGRHKVPNESRKHFVKEQNPDSRLAVFQICPQDNVVLLFELQSCGTFFFLLITNRPALVFRLLLPQ